MSKILVTGGAGFIGSCMAERLARDPLNQVVVVDNLTTGDISKIVKAENITFIKCDVNSFNDISSVFYSWKFDFVFHYSALVGVQRTQENPAKVLQDIEGIKNVLNLSKNTGVKRVFYSSSSEVYGEPVEIPQNERTTPLNSKLPYAIVKNVGEAYLRAFKKEFGLEYTIFRFFNTYGTKQSEDFVIAKFITKALNNKDITIYGDGNQTRTFCYIDDNVDACEVIFRENMYVNDVVNVGSNVETSILQLAEMIIDITGSSSKIVHLAPLKEGDMRRRKPDIGKMQEALSRPLVSLSEGLKILVDAHNPVANVWH
jgi:UDP-glucose 4-epimerase